MKTAVHRPLFERIADQPFARGGIRPGDVDLTRRAIGLAQLNAGCRVLDVGCGTGVTVEHLVCESKIRAVGIDLSAALLAQGKAREPALPLTLGHAEALPFPDGSFDGVLFECTLSLIKGHEPVLSECNRVLKPLGAILITDLYSRNGGAIDKLRSLPVDSCLKGAIDADRFVDQCSLAGFGTVCWEDHSEVLRDFAFGIIWTYGSLDRFWGEVADNCVHPVEIRDAIQAARPGYFLYVGAKVGDRLPAPTRSRQ